MCSVIFCLQVSDITNFEINLRFFIKPFSYITKKVETKKKYEIKKHFLPLLQGFRWNK